MTSASSRIRTAQRSARSSAGLAKLILLCSAVTSLSGCVTRGENFSSNTSWIKVDQTSQVDVSVKLGRPYIVGNSSGVPTWTYGFYKHSLFGDSTIKELKFYFDKARKVSRFTFSSSFPEDRALN